MWRPFASFLTCAASCCVAGGALAQAVDTTLLTPDFNRLKTPESPAFQILGMAPSAIARPTSPRAFAFSFLEALRDQEQFSLVPGNFTVEVNPFWWSAHPGLSFRDYQAGGLRSLYRTFTLSLATTDSAITTAEGEASFRRLGVGARSMLFGRQPEPECLRAIERVVQPVNDAVAEQIALAIATDPTLARDAIRLEELRDRVFTQQLDDLPAEDKAVLSAPSRQACTDEIANRRGFVMSIAGAAGFGFLQESDPGALLARPRGGIHSLGVWVTPSWLSGRFSAIGVARLAWDGLQADSTRTTALDLGGRAVYSYGRYAASGEALWRHRGDGDTGDEQYRLAALFDVRLTPDLWLSATFGKDFEATSGSGLIALANLQWNLGKPAARPVPRPE